MFSLLRKVRFISVFLLIIFVNCNVELRTDEVNGIGRQHFGLVGNTHVTQLRAERFEPLRQCACGDMRQPCQFGLGHRA